MTNATKFEIRINAVDRAMAATRKQQARFDHVKQVGANIRDGAFTTAIPVDTTVQDSVSAADATFAMLNQAVKTSVQSAAERTHQMRRASDAFDSTLVNNDAADAAKVIDAEVIIEEITSK